MSYRVYKYVTVIVLLLVGGDGNGYGVSGWGARRSGRLIRVPSRVRVQPNDARAEYRYCRPTLAEPIPLDT